MKKNNLLIFIIILLSAVSLMGQPFYFVTYNFDEDVLDKLPQIENFLQKNQYFTDNIIICTGSIFKPNLFNIYSTVFFKEDYKPISVITEGLITNAILPNSSDLDFGLAELKRVCDTKVPIVITDGPQPTKDSLFYQTVINDKKITIFNITTIPSDWYENISKKIDLFSQDVIVLIMDKPDLRIVPEALKSKTITIGRDTAVYRVDLELGILFNKINIPQEVYFSNLIEKEKERFEAWKKTNFEIDPELNSFNKEITFYSFLGLMTKIKFNPNLIFFLKRDLPTVLSAQDTYNFFKDYVYGEMTIQGGQVRKILESSASLYEFDGIKTKYVGGGNYFSLYGEPYWIDLTLLKGNRLIIKTFSEDQRVIFVGEKSSLENNFPNIRFLETSPLFYLFWSLRGGNPPLKASWRVINLPYLLTYSIQKGDSLNSIAQKFNTTINSIKAFNPRLLEMYLLPDTIIRLHEPFEFETRIGEEN